MSGCCSVEAIIPTHRLRYNGHVVRMGDRVIVEFLSYCSMVSLNKVNATNSRQN